MITNNEIRQAFKLFLGREPESDDVINSLCQSVHSLEELRHVFISSPEFIKAISGNSQNINQKHPYHLPYIPVEWDANIEILEKIFKRISEGWESLGNSEPYWSVVTQPKYYKKIYSEYSEEFYQSGRHIRDLSLNAIRRSGVNPADLKSCLEIGCGVGRVTSHLSEVYDSVLAVDISRPHLAIASSFIREMGIQNVDFIHLKTLSQLESIGTIDMVHSVITFQHNPPPIISWLLKTSLNLLRSGGVAFIQIPTYKSGYFFEIERYLSGKIENQMEMHFLPQRTIYEIIDNSKCRCLEIREDQMVGHEDSMLSNTFVVQKK